MTYGHGDVGESVRIRADCTSDLKFDELCAPATMPRDVAGNDLFALGAIVALLFDCDSESLVAREGSVPSLRFDMEVPTGLRELVESMLADDPLDRPLADEVSQQLHDILGVECGAAGVIDLDGPRAELEAALASGLENNIAETIELADAQLPPMRLRRDATALAGQRLGRHQLQQQLGAGATGAVYRAVDDADGAIVAVKVLDRQYASRPGAIKRFR